ATLAARTGATARTMLKAEQTVRLSGAEAESQLAYDPKLPPSARFEVKLSGIFEKGVATQADIEGIFKEIAGIPPLRSSVIANSLPIDSLPAFPVEIVQNCKDDGKDSLLREKVREAVQLLKENNQAFQETFLRDFDTNNQQQVTNFKNQIAQIQMN